MMGLYKTGKVPFEKVYLHGLIRDEKGLKMSKSRGNVVNPLDVTEKYGADALRMALVIRSTPGQDKNVGDDDIRAMGNLTNKIWNAARFVILQSKTPQQSGSPHSARSARGDAADLDSVSTASNSVGDKEFLGRLNIVVENVTRQMESLRIGLAAETVYNEFWHWFCDECIEKNKKGEISDKSLLEGLVVFLKLLHPFVPFVTEVVYQELRAKGLAQSESEMLMVSKWPEIRSTKSERTKD